MTFGICIRLTLGDDPYPPAFNCETARSLGPEQDLNILTRLASTGPDVASSSISRKDVSTFWLQDPQRSVEFGQLTRPVSEGISQALAAPTVITT